jgi:transforming growth factor-beta-induced protein
VVGNNKVMINDATVTGADVLTITGVLHAIDKLLVPPGVSLNALAAKPIPGATAPPQTSPPSTQPLVTTAPTTQPPATNPSAAATQVPSGATTTIATPTTKVP